MANSTVSIPVPTGTVKEIRTDLIGGVHYQQNKLVVGAADTAELVVDDRPLPAGVVLWNGTAWVKARSNPGALSAGDALQGVIPMTLNASGTFDREESKLDASLLASAARTATTISPTITSPSAGGVLLTVGVTALTAGASLAVAPYGLGGPSNLVIYAGHSFADLPVTPITATGVYGYLIHPAAAVYNPAAPLPTSGYVVWSSPYALPRRWAMRVSHATADSVTYSVEYALLN